MGLVGEAGAGGDGGERLCRSGELLKRIVTAQPGRVLRHRAAEPPAKFAAEVGGMHADFAGDRGETQRIAEMLTDVRFSAIEPARRCAASIARMPQRIDQAGDGFFDRDGANR